MFEKLIEYYREYSLARKKKPYCKDKVQAMGLRFCEEWNNSKKAICEHFKIPEDEFDYSLHHTLMPKLIEQYV